MAELQSACPLSRFIDKIVIIGFNCNSIPAITNLTYFMNQSFQLNKLNRLEEAREIDLLVGVLLISTKRSTQTAELFRKIEGKILDRIQSNMSRLQKYAEEGKNGKEAGTLRAETQQLFVNCALLELLIAEGFSFETHLNEKIQALQRMVEFSQGQVLPE